MTNQDLYRYAEKLVNKCAVPPHLSGHTYLTDAIVIKSKNRTAKLIDIYSAIALKHNSTHRAVTRNITYAISQSEHIGGFLKLDSRGIFNGSVIAKLVIMLKDIFHLDS